MSPTPLCTSFTYAASSDDHSPDNTHSSGCWVCTPYSHRTSKPRSQLQFYGRRHHCPGDLPLRLRAHRATLFPPQPDTSIREVVLADLQRIFPRNFHLRIVGASMVELPVIGRGNSIGHVQRIGMDRFAWASRLSPRTRATCHFCGSRRGWIARSLLEDFLEDRVPRGGVADGCQYADLAQHQID